MRDAHYMGPGAWPPRTIFKTTFKMVHSLGNREETNAYAS